MSEKRIYDTIIQSELITKGWSSDDKYRTLTSDGQHLLLRVSSIKEHDLKKAEYNMMKRVYNHGVPTSRPVEFGLCNDGKSVYQLYGWIEGEDAEIVLPLMSETEQYVLGYKAGEILRKIHTIPMPSDSSDWSAKYFSVIDERIEAYRREGPEFAGNEIILEYLIQNRNLLNKRPQSCIHGDFHEGNLMIAPDGGIYVIDFLDEGFGNQGDSWYDFKTFGENDNAYFSTGLVRGYFGEEPLQEFWDVLTYYYVNAALTAIVWTKYNKPEELQEAIKWNERNVIAIQEGHSPLMKWYLKDYCVQWLDDIAYALKEPFDFSFISKYGKVFKVFDNSYSGAICFGVEKSGKRYFLKFAGAKTFDATCQNIEDIIMMLKISVPKYKDLKHPLLINQIGAEEVPCGATGGGFITVYDWFDGEGCGYMHPVTQTKFLALPNKDKQRVYEGILDFHAHVIECGYIAIDFNNGSTLYNFDTGDFAFCDIDFYAKHSQISGWSGIWGDPSLKSPEECRGYSVITEVSNVYTMGAVAFYLFAGDDKVSREKWTLSEKQYKAAKKAISEKRSERQQTIQQFITEWRAAK